MDIMELTKKEFTFVTGGRNKLLFALMLGSTIVTVLANVDLYIRRQSEDYRSDIFDSTLLPLITFFVGGGVIVMAKYD